MNSPWIGILAMFVIGWVLSALFGSVEKEIEEEEGYNPKDKSPF